MPHWKHTLKVAGLFHNDSLPFTYLRDGVVRRIKVAPFYDPEDADLVDIVDELAESQDVEQFDYAWDSFYDWCDEHRVWVETLP